MSGDNSFNKNVQPTINDDKTEKGKKDNENPEFSIDKVRELIKEKNGEELRDYLSKFSNLDKRVAFELLNADTELGMYGYVSHNIVQFPPEDHKDIAIKIIEIGAASCILENIKNYKGLDTEVALKFMDDDVNDGKYLSYGAHGGEFAAPINGVQFFENLDYEKIVSRAFELGLYKQLMYNFEKFPPETIDANKLAWGLIETGNIYYLADSLNLRKLKGLSNEVAIKLIENGDKEIVKWRIKSFEGLDESTLDLINKEE